MQRKAIHRKIQEIVDGRNYDFSCALASFMVLGWSFVAWRVCSTSIVNLFYSNVLLLTLFYFCSWLCCYMSQMNPLIGPKLSNKTILLMAREWGNAVIPENWWIVRYAVEESWCFHSTIVVYITHRCVHVFVNNSHFVYYLFQWLYIYI